VGDQARCESMGNLVPNPFAAVAPVERPGEGRMLEVYAPRRGGRLAPSLVRSDTEPELYDALSRVLGAENCAVRDVVPSLIGQHRSRLRELGLALTPSRVPAWPAYACELDHSAARRAEDLSPDVDSVLRDVSYFVSAPVVGVRDSSTQVVWPYWRRPMKKVRAAGPSSQRSRVDGWEDHALRARDDLRRHRFASLRGAIPRTHVSALARYFGDVVDNGLSPYREDSRRWYRHGDPVARLFHRLLAPVIQSVVSEPIKPSYPYFAAYPRGTSLSRHTDREQCEYTVSLLVGHEPRGNRELAWPIYLEPPSGIPMPRVRLLQRPGDMLIFKGREIPHWRPQLRCAARSLHIFFHFVPQDFAKSLD